MDTEYQMVPEGRLHRTRRNLWHAILRYGDAFLDWLENRLKIMIQEKDLFLGTLFFILGFFNFHSGKYCDGNAADYLSCTRPVTYYYYTWIEMILVILGVFLVMLWFLQRNRR